MENNLIIPFVCAINSVTANVSNMNCVKIVALFEIYLIYVTNRVIDTSPYPWIRWEICVYLPSCMNIFSFMLSLVELPQQNHV